jgi:hypothetical protein
MITANRRRRATKTPVEVRDVIDTWKDGYVDSKTADRIGKTGLRSTVNQILKQDGTLAQRPSTVLYGVQPLGTVLGEIVEFTKRTIATVNVTENYELSIQNVSGTTNAYYRKDGGSWTLASGKTFSTTARAHLCPIRDIDSSYNDEDKVLITNGVDTLSYLDINTLTVVPFVSLSAATINTATVGSGVTGTNFNHRYKVTAGNKGETAASAETTKQTSVPRSEWTNTGAANGYIDIVINRVTNATRYHIYYSTETNQETYLASVDDPGSGTTVTWRDTGFIDPNPYRPAPAGDTTAGPIGTRATFINGQVFITGDKSNPKYVRYGGTGQHILDFSPYGGGGYEPVGGNKEIPVKVAAFRKNDGTPAITVLCKGTNGFGKRYIFSPSTIAGSNVSFFAVSEENGNDGTEAPDSVIQAKDQLWYLSSDGGKTTLTKAQVQTILSTEGMTDSIENTVARFNTAALEYAVGLAYQNRLYWAVAIGSDRNNQILCLDLSNLRRGAWMGPWTVAADWMWLYNDNTGKTHFCILSGNQVLEFTDNVATQDNGVAFPTSTSLGIQKSSKDGKEWIDMSRLTFVFNNLEGSITCGLSGKTEDNPLAILGSETFTSVTQAAGWGERGWGALTWGDFEAVPSQQYEERQEIVIEVGEELNWYEPNISTTDANTRYELLEIIPEYTPIGIKE